MIDGRHSEQSVTCCVFVLLSPPLRRPGSGGQGRGTKVGASLRPPPSPVEGLWAAHPSCSAGLPRPRHGAQRGLSVSGDAGSGVCTEGLGVAGEKSCWSTKLENSHLGSLGTSCLVLHFSL